MPLKTETNTRAMMLNATSQEIRDFLDAWHENGRANFVKTYENLDYDSYKAKRAKERKRFIALDCGDSGVFLCERTTGDLYSIKAYGVPNRKIASLTGLTRAYRDATANSRELPGPGYVATDLALAKAVQS